MFALGFAENSRFCDAYSLYLSLGRNNAEVHPSIDRSPPPHRQERKASSLKHLRAIQLPHRLPLGQMRGGQLKSSLPGIPGRLCGNSVRDTPEWMGERRGGGDDSAGRGACAAIFLRGEAGENRRGRRPVGSVEAARRTGGARGDWQCGGRIEPAGWASGVRPKLTLYMARLSTMPNKAQQKGETKLCSVGLNRTPKRSERRIGAPK